MAYEVLQELFSKNPDNPVVNEKYFDLFMRMGDDENIRLLFKKLNKTKWMWDAMIDYIFTNGSIEEYKELIQQREEALTRGDILPPAPSGEKAQVTARGCEGIYLTVKNSFCYMGLEFKTDDIVGQFLKQLPRLEYSDNVLINIDLGDVVELIAGASI